MNSQLRHLLSAAAHRQPPTLASRSLAWTIGRLKAIGPSMFYQIHCVVHGYEDPLALPYPEPQIELEFGEIRTPDRSEIDGLILVDEWKISESEIFELLKEGWICYAAKHHGDTIGCAWAFAGDEIVEPHFGRKLRLAGNEAYVWRGSSLKTFRGKGVMSALLYHLAKDLAQQRGITSGLGITRAHNKPMLRAYAKMGWPRLGRTGFVQILGIQIQYLCGRAAFPATKKRIHIGFMRARPHSH